MADRPLTEEQYRHLADEHGLDETCAHFVRDLATSYQPAPAVSGNPERQ